MAVLRRFELEDAIPSPQFEIERQCAQKVLERLIQTAFLAKCAQTVAHPPMSHAVATAITMAHGRGNVKVVFTPEHGGFFPRRGGLEYPSKRIFDAPRAEKSPTPADY